MICGVGSLTVVVRSPPGAKRLTQDIPQCATPQMIFSIDGHAVGLAPFGRKLQKDAARPERPVIVQREPEDETAGAVRVIKQTAVVAEGGTIGNRVAVVRQMHAAVGIQAVEIAHRLIRRNRHRACEDAPVCIGLAVIEARVLHEG